MEVATIVPAKHLNVIELDKVVLALSYLVRINEPYRRFMIQKSTYNNCLIILDNSVIELKHPEPIEKLVIDAGWIGAKEVVLPDVSRNKLATLDSTRSAVKYVEKAYPHGAPFKLMAAPQGETKAEWMFCAEAFLDMGVDTLGISYLYNPLFGSRVNMINAILPLVDPNKTALHLLGCHQNPAEIREVAKAFPFVRSVDSASAAIYTKYGMRLSDQQPRPGRDIDFDNDELDEKLLEENVNWWRERCLND